MLLSDGKTRFLTAFYYGQSDNAKKGSSGPFTRISAGAPVSVDPIGTALSGFVTRVGSLPGIANPLRA